MKNYIVNYFFKHFFLLVSIVLSSFILFAQGNYEEFDKTVSGLAEETRIGKNISISGNGKVIAFGTENYDEYRGYVSVYENINDKLVKRGESIKGSKPYDCLGRDVALNRDGNVLAISQWNSLEGSVNVFEYKNSIWTKVGNTIRNPLNVEEFGSEIKLSGDGKTLVIGTYTDGSFVEGGGSVKVFEFINNNWKSKGTIYGKNQHDWFGISVDINETGNIIAVGAVDDDTKCNNCGSVSVFKYSGISWDEVGGKILSSGERPNHISEYYFEETKENFGKSVSLSAEGNVVAVGIGGSLTYGGVEVFKIENNKWVKVGQSLWGKEYGENFGESISLTSDGKKLAVGSPLKNSNEVNAGSVSCYNFDGNYWLQNYYDLHGDNKYDWFGSSVELSDDGNFLVAGAPLFDSPYSQCGQVKMFSFHNFEAILNRYVEKGIVTWSEKGEFEKTEEFLKRVNEESTNKKISKLQDSSINVITNFLESNLEFSPNTFLLNEYDADNETFLLVHENTGALILPVPLMDAPKFKSNFGDCKFSDPEIQITASKAVLKKIKVELATIEPIIYTNSDENNYNGFEIKNNLLDVNIKLVDSNKKINNSEKKVIILEKPNIDINIPKSNTTRNNTYALIIGNEDYQSRQTGLTNEQNVDFALNDAIVFGKYCNKTLGIPEKQIKLLMNATYAEMQQGLSWIENLAKVENRNANLIFYYSGHGLPHQNTKEPYLIPVDVSGSNVNLAIKLEDVLKKLSTHPSKQITVFLDACFSGGARNEGLVAMKGMKIKPEEENPMDNMIVFSSSTGEETSAVYKEKQHGYFTYFLLKKLQETKGEVTLGELSEYISNSVSKATALDGIIQTPIVQVGENLKQNWKIINF